MFQDGASMVRTFILKNKRLKEPQRRKSPLRQLDGHFCGSNKTMLGPE